MDLGKKSVSEFVEWLKKEGFSETVMKIFEENEIDGEAFLLQSDEDIKDLVPLYGPRAKLIKKRNEAANCDNPSEVKTSLVKSSELCAEITSEPDDLTAGYESDASLFSLDTLSTSTISANSEQPEIGLQEETVEALDMKRSAGDPDEDKENVDQPRKKPKLELMKKSTPFSKKNQESPLPMPFQLPANMNPDLAESLNEEIPSLKSQSRIASLVADTIFFHKSYPSTDELRHVAQQMVKRWPSLTRGGSYEHLVIALREKMNYRRKPTDRKRGKPRQSTCSTAYKPKALQMPSSSTVQDNISSQGEDQASHDKHVKLLKQECKKVNPSRIVCKDLMKRTYPFRRPAVINKEHGLTVDRIFNDYPGFRYPEEILREYDRIHPEFDTAKIVELWDSLVPTIIELARIENQGEIMTLLDGEEEFTHEYRSIVAICALYYLLPDPRTIKNHTRIITILEATAQVNEVAENIFSPQPSIVLREDNRGVKDAFIMIQRKPLPTKLDPKQVIAALFASFTVFNVHYTEGCTNFFTLLEVLFLKKKVPQRKPRLSSILNKLK